MPGRAAEPPTPPDVAAYFHSTPDATEADASTGGEGGAESIYSDVIGDLTGHQTLDWAGIAWRAADNVGVASDERGPGRLYIFLEGPEATHRPVARSQPLSTQCGTARCWLEELRIARQSVYVTWATSWHGCFDRSTSQFKRVGDRWRLVGVRRESREDPYGDDDLTPSREVIVDRNALTGDTIVSVSIHDRHTMVRHMKIDAPSRWLEDYSLDLDFGVPHSRAIPVTCGRE